MPYSQIGTVETEYDIDMPNVLKPLMVPVELQQVCVLVIICAGSVCVFMYNIQAQAQANNRLVEEPDHHILPLFFPQNSWHLSLMQVHVPRS